MKKKRKILLAAILILAIAIPAIVYAQMVKQAECCRLSQNIAMSDVVFGHSCDNITADRCDTGMFDPDNGTCIAGQDGCCIFASMAVDPDCQALNKYCNVVVGACTDTMTAACWPVIDNICDLNCTGSDDPDCGFKFAAEITTFPKNMVVGHGDGNSNTKETSEKLSKNGIM